MSGQGQKQALERSRDIRAVKAGEVDVWRVPPVKMAELARYGMNAHAPTLRRLAEPRRTATVLATMRHLEGAAVDDALTLFDVLMATKLLARAERADIKEQMKGLPRFRRAAAKMRAAVAVFLDVPIERQVGGDDEEEGSEPLSVAVALAEGWEIVEQIVTREELVKAVVDLGELLPEGTDTAWRKQLIDRYATARRFTSLLAEVIPWGATKAGTPIVEALRELPKVQARRKPGVEHIDTTLLDGSWRRLVLGNPLLAPNGIIDSKAWTFCVLENLHTALKRRDVHARGADNWGDPRARLLSGADWQVNRPRVLTALELSGSAGEHLGELEVLLDEMYAHVAENLPGNAAVDIVDGKIRLDRLEAEEEPAGYKMVHDAVQAMLPKVDYPELLLEVHARTGMFDCFEHIGGKVARAPDLDLTLTALLVHRSTNIGLEPVIKPGEKALTRSQLAAADSGYFSPANMGAASGLLVQRQGDIDLVGDWGGGHVASADGMRFTVPVRSIHTRPNRKYFSTGRGATWLNVVGPGHGSGRHCHARHVARLARHPGRDVQSRQPRPARDRHHRHRLLQRLGVRAVRDLRLPVLPQDRGHLRCPAVALRHGPGLRAAAARLPPACPGRADRAELGGHAPRRRLAADRQGAGLRPAADDDLRRPNDRPRRRVRALRPDFQDAAPLQFIDSEAYRRMIGVQLNIGEGRHALGRRIFFGRLGELRHGYRDGMEDQLGALGMALNSVVWWNSLYMDAAVKKLEAGGVTISKDIRSRLSPLVHEHINFHGRYPIVRSHGDGALRALRSPNAGECRWWSRPRPSPIPSARGRTARSAAARRRRSGTTGARSSPRTRNRGRPAFPRAGRRCSASTSRRPWRSCTSRAAAPGPRSRRRKRSADR